METLRRPGWLVPLGDRDEAVLAHSVPVTPAWWRGALAATPFAGEEPPDGDQLTRGDLVDLAEDATRSALGARRLLWATLSWGTGKRHRLNRARIRSVARATDGGDVLREAAALSRTDPRAAYGVLRPTRSNAVPYLGPPFFTKFLYFAGAGEPDHPCLILDPLVADALQNDCGWTSLTGRTWWPSATYLRYCELLAAWAADVPTEPGTRVAADELERALFRRGRQRMRGPGA